MLLLDGMFWDESMGSGGEGTGEMRARWLLSILSKRLQLPCSMHLRAVFRSLTNVPVLPGSPSPCSEEREGRARGTDSEWLCYPVPVPPQGQQQESGRQEQTEHTLYPLKQPEAVSGLNKGPAAETVRADIQRDQAFLLLFGKGRSD